MLGVTQLHFEEIPAALVADQPVWKLNKTIGAILQKVEPEILYVPFPFDLHKDHGETFHALSVAWRTSSPIRKIKSVYCYEVGSRRHTGTHRTSRPASCRTLGLTSPRTSRLN